ncbi:MAG: hypothetical protein ABJD53_10240 [Gammaproteobacteria bacterium]
MRIAKPLLMVTTPIGVGAGLYECVRLAGGLVIVMLAMVGVMLAALATVVATVRREGRAARPGGSDAAESVATGTTASTSTPGVACNS